MAVYFVKAGSRVKVGYSDNVPRRLAQLQTGCPKRLTLLAVIEHGTLAYESAIHSLLHEYRSGGEWFEYRGECRAFIRAIIGGANPTWAGLHNLWEFSTCNAMRTAAQVTVADPDSSHEQLRDAHIFLRDSKKLHSA